MNEGTKWINRRHSFIQAFVVLDIISYMFIILFGFQDHTSIVVLLSRTITCVDFIGSQPLLRYPDIHQ